MAGADLGMIGKSLVNCELFQSNCMNELVRSDPKFYIRRNEIKLLKEHRGLFIQGQTIWSKFKIMISFFWERSEGTNGHYKKKLYCNKLFCCNKLEIVAIKPYYNKNILLHIIAINSVLIGYCNKIFIAIAFYCNKIILLLLKILYCNKNIIAIIYYNVIRLHTLKFFILWNKTVD